MSQNHCKKKSIEIFIPVSIGEIIDKMSILKIKSEKITDLKKQKQINEEFNRLKQTLAKHDLLGDSFDDFLKQLYYINLKIWDLEDKIRDKDRRAEFNHEFMQIAKEIHDNNDQRFLIKRKINEEYNSVISEFKSYDYLN